MLQLTSSSHQQPGFEVKVAKLPRYSGGVIKNKAYSGHLGEPTQPQRHKRKSEKEHKILYLEGTSSYQYFTFQLFI